MPISGGEKLCPICDSPLQPGSKKCSFCGTDLSIFDIEVETPKQVPAAPASPPPERTSVESRVNEVFSRPSPSPVQASPAPPIRQQPVAEQPKPPPPKVAPEPPPAPARAPAPAPVAPPKAKPAPPPEEVEETFECPQCGTQMPISASTCPKCGVMFAEEGGEMFQCPACNTLVNVDATQCPGCGAIFVEADDAAAAQTSDTVEAAAEIEAPVEEVKPTPEPVTEAEAKSKEEQKADKKGIGGWFKWGKKEPAPEPEKPAGSERPAQKPAPAESRIPAPVRAAPKAAPEVKAVREVTQQKTPERPVQTQSPSPAPKAPAPVSRPAVTPQPVQTGGRDKGRDLARMVAEMKPLLAIAREKEVDIGESKQLIDEAALAGKERQLDKAIELVQRSKTALMQRIDSSLGQLVMKLNDEIKMARDFGGDISRATTYMQEVTKARASGDVEAAYVYADKISKELQPITGRYNESRNKLAGLKQLIADCDAFIVDTKDARRNLVEANKALDLKDFDKAEMLVKAANDGLYKVIPLRMKDELKKAQMDLIDLKMKDVNISGMLTVLKSASGLMKSGDYSQALKEMREFKDMIKKAS